MRTQLTRACHHCKLLRIWMKHTTHCACMLHENKTLPQDQALPTPSESRLGRLGVHYILFRLHLTRAIERNLGRADEETFERLFDVLCVDSSTPSSFLPCPL